MNNFELENSLVECVQREREATAEVLRLLREVEARKLHLERGYPSLFEYCRRKLGYSEPEANLRIQAMRLMRAVPEVEAHLERGGLSLSVAAQIQNASHREELALPERKLLVAELIGFSKREAEKVLAEKFPETARPEKVRPIAGGSVEIRFTLTAEEAALLGELMNRRAHSNFDRRYEKLVMDLVRKELREPAAVGTPPQRPELAQRNRHVPAAVCRAVFKRDQGRCQYADSASGHRCESRHGVQVDHFQPYSLGGTHTLENLRLLCGAHNRWRHAEQFRESS